MDTKRIKARARKKRTSTLATDIGLVVVSSLLSAATGFAAARDLRGAMIGATGGAALPLAYRAVLHRDVATKLGYGATALAFSAISIYLSWTRGPVGGVTPAQIAASAETPAPTADAGTAGLRGAVDLTRKSAFGAGWHG